MGRLFLYTEGELGMLIEILVSRVGPGISLSPGDYVEWPDEEALAFIAEGSARAVRGHVEDGHVVFDDEEEVPEAAAEEVQEEASPPKSKAKPKKAK